VAARLRVIAVATPAFALPTLEALAAAPDVELVRLITKEDKPAGRGLRSQPPPVYDWAVRRGVPVAQTAKLSRPGDGGAPDADVAADALVVVASAFFIPGRLRDPQPAGATTFGAVNLHPSLLPELRGPAPVNWALILGYEATGVTTIALTDEMDAGDIFLQQEVAVASRDTAATLGARLAEAGAALVLATLRGLAAGTVTRRPQEPARARNLYRPKITADVQQLAWTRPAAELDRLVRGLAPAPGAWLTFRGGVVHIVEAEAVAGAGAPPGTIIASDADGVAVACGEGALRLRRVKPAGKAEMTARAFALGRRLEAGSRWE
jgi:methionyl-tRNA formyltransferase